MALRAKRDTFALDPVGPDVEVRRQITAGAYLPAGFIPENDSDFEDAGSGPPMVGFGAAAPAYKHQLDETGQLREEHRVVVEDQEETAPGIRKGREASERLGERREKAARERESARKAEQRRARSDEE